MSVAANCRDMKKEDPIVSVIISTFERPALLKRCLQGLLDQTLVSAEIEVIVIDNASMCSTEEIVAAFVAQGLPVRCLREPQPGLSAARNFGLYQSKGTYVAFIDDDAVPYPDWLFQIKSFISHVPDAAAFGGPYDGYTLVTKPPWFPPDYGSWELEPEMRRLEIGREWINGTNMVFRKEILLAVGGFDTQLGMKEKVISYGEETRVLLELKRRSLSVYYVPEMRVQHLIADYKMSLRWLLSSAYAVGRCTRAVFGNPCSAWVVMVMCIFSGINVAVKMVTLPSMPAKRRLYYSLVDMCRAVGALVETFTKK